MVHKKKVHYMWRGGITVFVLAFLLNFVWESVHAVLFFEGHAEYVSGFFVRMVSYASFMDALLIFVIFCAGCLLFKGDCWLEHYGRKEFWFTVVLGIVFAAIIEIKNLIFNQWSYNEWMPTIFGFGLSPMVQLAVTGALSMFVTSKLFYGKKH